MMPKRKREHDKMNHDILDKNNHISKIFKIMNILNVNVSKYLAYDIYITILKYFIYVIYMYIVYIYLRIGYFGKFITSPFIIILPTLNLF
jgi:hypothetical protein